MPDEDRQKLVRKPVVAAEPLPDFPDEGVPEDVLAPADRPALFPPRAPDGDVAPRLEDGRVDLAGASREAVRREGIAVDRLDRGLRVEQRLPGVE